MTKYVFDANEQCQCTIKTLSAEVEVTLQFFAAIS